MLVVSWWVWIGGGGGGVREREGRYGPCRAHYAAEFPLGEVEFPVQVVVDQREGDHARAQRVEEEQAAELEEDGAALGRDGAEQVPRPGFLLFLLAGLCGSRNVIARRSRMRVVVCSGKQWFSLCILMSRFGELLVLALLAQQQREKSLHQPDSRVHPEHGAVRIELRPAVAGRERVDDMAADDQARRSPQYGEGNVPRAISLVSTSCF